MGRCGNTEILIFRYTKNAYYPNTYESLCSPALTGIRRVRNANRVNRAFLGLDKHQQNLEAIAFRRTRNGFVIDIQGRWLQRLLVPFFAVDWFEFHLLLHVDRGRVDPVVFVVGGNEFDLNRAKLVSDYDNQAVVIALTIEHNPVHRTPLCVSFKLL